MNLGLTRIRQLLASLDNPHTRLLVIHVAGTNGKGSICAYLASILHASGLRVGRFNSPALLTPRDTLCIDGIPSTVEEFRLACDAVLNADREAGIGATPFELLTAISFWWFDRRHVDVAVVEVGLGGRLDATNVFDAPLATVVASIGMDHVNILGDTIDKIAREKAGIMKPERPCIIAPQPERLAEETLIQHAKNLRCPHLLVEPAEWENPSALDGWARITLSQTSSSETLPHVLRFPIPLHGDYQLSNAATAIQVIHLLRTTHLTFSHITDTHIVDGMHLTRWPGRLDLVTSTAYPKLATLPLHRVLVDGAHNPPAAEPLRAFVDRRLLGGSNRRVYWLLAMTQGKDLAAILKILLREGDRIAAVGFSTPEGMPWVQATEPGDIVRAAEEVAPGCEAKAFSGLEEAMRWTAEWVAKKEQEDAAVVLCGSLYFVADFYRWVGMEEG
ncbi:Mur ligase [Endogone sp. FLAS-F59071]|nr:Mur ligase [Endogone sp. FLAS-F59071]|eukprot:RUS18238.1 Mur ligase [Endogone sp. FLAS-F59071]